MDFTSLPIAALPLPPSVASVPSGPSPSPRKHLPLAQRLTLNPTITAKVNYYDLAQTRRPPFDLRTALIWLCLCSHDNSVWWEPRSPDHQDGADAAPLPLALNFSAWMRYIQQWQADTFTITEDQDIEALAIRVWLGAHETVCVPEEPDPSKKNASPVPLTGLNSTPTSSAAATPDAATTSSSPCPSAPPMPSSTHGSPPPESPASPLLSPTAETPKLTPSSPPPVNEPFWVAEHSDTAAGYAGRVDENGFISTTGDIHKALHFVTEAECRDWLSGMRNAGSFAPQEHLIH